MSWKLRVLVPALLFAPQAAFALGLGDIRLGSALNEPLSAEIDLVAATPDEVSTLQARLASRDLFQRYGLDRPGFLDGIEFRIGRGQDGRSVLLVRSQNPISEPFVTFLVEVNWPRGRLLREYTVLLDPPVFAPKVAEAAPVAAPRVQAPASGPAPAPAAAPPAPAPVSRPASPAPAAAGSSYRVKRGDTLYGISSGLSGGDRADANRMMVALFRANPEAFNGNINLLRAGAILRVPSQAEAQAIGAGEASSEISRQNRDWRSGSASEPDAGRLRLVTPDAGAAPAGGRADDGSVKGQISALEREIAEQRRLLELRNQELAQLQNQLAAEQAAAAAAAAVPEAPVEGGEAAVAPEDDPTAGAAAPAPAETAKPAKAAAAEAPPAPSWFDRLADNWLYALGAAGLLFGGLLGYGYVRRRREEDLDDALRSFDMPASAPVPSETMRLRALAMGAAQSAAKPEPEVEARPAAPARKRAAEPAEPASHDQTISTEAALDLDTADPLAEADFHMAYGLYDQAADLVRMAIENEPKRLDLKMKLAEIHFVAGDEAAFLDAARELERSRSRLDGGDWDRIVIMGRQIAGEDPLFADATASTSVDLSLEGGQSRVDLELLSPPGGDDGLDIDLGEAFAASDDTADTGENEMIDLDFDGGETTSTDATHEVPRSGSATSEMPTFELPAQDAPTIEAPGLSGSTGDTVREKIGESGFAGSASTDATAEMSIDDLDLSGLEGLDDPSQDDMTREMPRGGQSSDDTGRTAMLPELDIEGTAMMPELELPGGEDAGLDLDVGQAPAERETSPTATERMSLDDLPAMTDLEPVTMSEVGTKLDLARAYMDMGDPDGARNILEEVLSEGSSAQKKEAQRLIDSLPGA